MLTAGTNPHKVRHLDPGPESLLDFDDKNYRLWRNYKLALRKQSDPGHKVILKNTRHLSADEIEQIQRQVLHHNFAIYQYDSENSENHEGYQQVCLQLGLINSISHSGSNSKNIAKIQSIEQSNDQINPGPVHSHYIPYSTQALNWHTDGYYNGPEKQVRSFVLHCQRHAEYGGENQLFDHELLYLLLRDQNPEWARALTNPACFEIPADTRHGETLRAEFRGAVFSTDSVTGNLYARYTQRKRHITWQSNKNSKDAIEFLRSLLDDHNPWSTTVKLQPGEGVICNNILHKRNAFKNENTTESSRCLYRIRFRDRIAQPLLIPE